MQRIGSPLARLIAVRVIDRLAHGIFLGPVVGPDGQGVPGRQMPDRDSRGLRSTIRDGGQVLGKRGVEHGWLVGIERDERVVPGLGDGCIQRSARVGGNTGQKRLIRPVDGSDGVINGDLLDGKGPRRPGRAELLGREADTMVDS